MSPVVVVYTSQTGFTQQYALWIAKQLHCELVDSKFLTTADLTGRKVVIYGGHLWANRVGGFAHFYNKYAPELPAGLFVFGAGVAQQAELDLQRVRDRNFTRCQVKPQFFYFRGQLDLKTLPVRLKIRARWHARRTPPPRSACQTGPAAVMPLLKAVQQTALEENLLGLP